MAEKLTIRIKSEKLGTVSQVIKFLKDFEKLYNSLLIFDLLTERIRTVESQDVENFERDLKLMEKTWYRFEKRADPYPEFRYFFRDYFEDKFFTKQISTTREETLEILKNDKLDDLLLDNERLIITKVNIQSPGFWEFLGSLNPLQQIREYIKDCHDRKKDNLYRNRQEEIKGEQEIEKNEQSLMKNQQEIEKNEIEIIQKRIEVLKSLGYDEIQVREIISKRIEKPLKKFNKHLVSRQIEGIE